MRIRWTLPAVDDLRSIGRFIAADNPSAARALLTKIRERTRTLRRSPRLGRVVPETVRDDLRELIEGNYRIVYRIRERSVDIIAVREGHQLLRPDALDL